MVVPSTDDAAASTMAMASSPLRFESRAARGRCLRRLFPKADPHGALLAHRRIDWTTDPASGRFPRPGGVGARERLCAADSGRPCWAGSATECSPIASTVGPPTTAA